ncbi:MAG: NAD-dependent epimerase/dehydratase family protein [Saprospiraceae bacterium]|nr:NAD-dependent epimerase/dehydratase family protein [Saprospiraceae bacterium]
MDKENTTTYRVLVTGAGGYVGKVAMRYLYENLKNGEIEALVAMDLKLPPESKQMEGVHYEAMDICDENLWTILDKYQITTVIHLVAILDSQSCPRELQYKIDVLGTKNILDACVKTGARRIIITSSGAAYGYYKDNPKWLKETDRIRGNKVFAYSDHKRLVEEMMVDYKDKHPELEQVILRVSTILGKTTDNLITDLFQKKVVLGVRGHLSPYVFIWDEDVAACLQYSVFTEKEGAYNLTGDGAIRNSDLAKLLGKPYLSIPAFVLRNALNILHKVNISQYGPEQILFLQYRPVLDNRRIKSEFGFTPRKTSLQTFKYYLKAQGKRAKNLKKIKIMMPK